MKKIHAAVLAVLAVAGCEGASLPGGAHYELATSNGKRPPVLLREDAGCRHVLHGATVDFDGRNGYNSSYDVRVTCGDSIAPVPQIGAAGRFRIRNDTAFFQDSATGQPTGFGLITADSLVVQGPAQRLVYVRR